MNKRAFKIYVNHKQR
jgi:hypothetical protein